MNFDIEKIGPDVEVGDEIVGYEINLFGENPKTKGEIVDVDREEIVNGDLPGAQLHGERTAPESGSDKTICEVVTVRIVDEDDNEYQRAGIFDNEGSFVTGVETADEFS